MINHYDIVDFCAFSYNGTDRPLNNPLSDDAEVTDYVRREKTTQYSLRNSLIEIFRYIIELVGKSQQSKFPSLPS